jgi:thiol:disulfide interchange protein
VGVVGSPDLLRVRYLVPVCLLLSAAVPAQAVEGPVRADHIEVELVAEHAALSPGTPSRLGLRIRTDRGWHVYWKNPGNAGAPPEVTWTLPPGFEAGEIHWPAPRRFILGPLANYGYEGEVLLPVTLAVPEGLPPGRVVVRARLSWLVCQEECLPGEAELTLSLPVADPPPLPEARWSALFAEADRRLPRPLADGLARAAQAGERLRLDVPAREVAWVEGETYLFYPEQAGVIHAAAPQLLEADDRAVALTLRIDPRGREAVSHLRGVLVREGPGARVAYAIDAPVAASAEAAPAAEAWAAPPSGVPGTLLLALLLAFAGGLILNLMPCVLPILSIKVLGFVSQAGENPRVVRRHGLVFGLGVLVSFWALAGLLLGLRRGGEELGWGFQLQEPAFVAAMAFVFFGLGLNLVGVFDVGFGLARVAGDAHGRLGPEGYGTSFWSGVLATVVATPCTAPFMGGALGYALGVPALHALLVFTALGVGMAAPYVVLACFPRWLARLPRPGPWMETLKQAMAFPLFATALLLAWVYGKQHGLEGMSLLLLGCLLVGMAAWAFGRFGQRAEGRRWVRGRALPLLLLLLGLLAPAAGGRLFAGAPADWQWEPFSAERVEALRAEGRPVFVDFTADWCVTCKFNEMTVLCTDTVAAAVRGHRVAMLQADWTRREPAITRALERFGRSSVPLYVVFAPGPSGRTIVLPTVITPDLVARAMAEAAGADARKARSE